MDEESVDPSIPVFKGMHEYKAVGDDGGMNDRVDCFHAHPLVRKKHAVHERSQVFGLGRDKMHSFVLP